MEFWKTSYLATSRRAYLMIVGVFWLMSMERSSNLMLVPPTSPVSAILFVGPSINKISIKVVLLNFNIIYLFQIFPN